VQELPAAPSSRIEEAAYPSKALKKFIACLAARPAPILIDLGPVVGANIAFFGERLGCKIYVEDLCAELERHQREGTLDQFPALLKARFRQEDESVDGVLCWDVFDHLDQAAARAAAAELTRVIRPNGALLAFFRTIALETSHYTRYVVVDEENLQHRPYGTAHGRQDVLQNRDIIKLFSGLRVSDSFLLKTNVREILFRRPAYLSIGSR
jgi:2-polyprenyl-3-methyl-5-hydroxy-6-metoxy-1,4-benzoquinol methylase